MFSPIPTLYLRGWYGSAPPSRAWNDLPEATVADWTRFGERCVSELDSLADEMERNVPVLEVYEPTGQFSTDPLKMCLVWRRMSRRSVRASKLLEQLHISKDNDEDTEQWLIARLVQAPQSDESALTFRGTPGCDGCA